MTHYILLLSALLVSHALAEKAERSVYGWLEYVHVGQGEYRMKAKLDSGAKTSSLHIIDKEVLTGKTGTQKVKFKITGSVERDGKRVLKTVTFTKPVHRTVRVKSSNGVVSTRISVLLPIRVGKTKLETEFTLSNRSGMNYPILLGRSTISDLGVIDCSSTFLMPKLNGTQK